MTAGTDSGEAVTVVYSTTITAVGEQVSAFLEHGILILFAADAPEELHSISVLHEADIRKTGPQPGDLVRIGDVEFPVLAVGPVVEDNLLNLGHVDFKADGRTDAKLPGDVCVPKDVLVMPAVGSTLSILRPSADLP